MADAGESTNTCCICLCTLASVDPDETDAPAVGACVPCGHCFHQPCFENWARHQRHAQNVKCPTCNGKSTGFVKLFLDLGNPETFIDDDDDSVSSLEEDDHLSVTLSSSKLRIAENQDESDSQPQTQEVNSNDEHRDDNADPQMEESQPEMVVIDDEDDDSVRLRASTTCPKSLAKTSRTGQLLPPDHEGNKYRSKFNRAKRRIKKLETHLASSAKQYQTVTENLENAVLAKTVMHEEFGKLEQAHDRIERKMHEIHLDLTRTKRERKEALEQIQELRRELDRTNTKLSEQKTHFEQHLERARVDSLSEVKGILAIYPKLTTENKALKETVMKKNEEIGQLVQHIKHISRSVESHGEGTVSHKETMQQERRASDAAKHFRSMQDSSERAHQKTQRLHIQKKRPCEAEYQIPPKAARKVLLSKGSEHAARMSAVTLQRKGFTALDALENADRPESRLIRTETVITPPSFLSSFTKSKARSRSIAPTTNERLIRKDKHAQHSSGAILPKENIIRINMKNNGKGRPIPKSNAFLKIAID